MNRSFKEYLTENKKRYDFRIKVAGEFASEKEKHLKSILEKYAVSEFKKTHKTPIQQLPLDFPQVKNCEVTIFEVCLDYPTTPFELKEYILSQCDINRQNLVIKNPNDPTEEYQNPADLRTTPLLTDPDYKESPNAKFEDYYGDKYNSGFVKELNDILKLQRKERGEQIPTEGAAKFSTDSEAHTKSPVIQAPDPRK